MTAVKELLDRVTIAIGNRGLYLLSRNIKEKWFNYVWQSAVAGVVTVVFLFVFYELVALVVLASVGSTLFSVFALPNIRTTQIRNIVGSYAICVIIGIACSFVSPATISGGAAVGAAAFFMVITDTEHPPAAGVALGLSITPLSEHLFAGAVFAIAGAWLAAICKYTLKPWLRDLT